MKNRCRSTPPRQEARVHVEDPTKIQTKGESGRHHRQKIIMDDLYIVMIYIHIYTQYIFIYLFIGMPQCCLIEGVD